MNISVKQVIYFGFFFHLITAIYSIGYHQVDEQFQIFEFAAYKLGLNNAVSLPWEFRAQMRSGLQPLIVFIISKLFYAINIENPFFISAFIRIVASLFSFFVTIRFIRMLEKQVLNQRFKILFWFLSLLLWCVPYLHARFSSENFSITLFIFGLTLLFEENEITKNVWWQLLAGLLFGFSFVVRFHLLFCLVGLFIYLIISNQRKINYFISIASGFLLAIAIGLIIDYWLYGSWVFSSWNYLYQNLFLHKADNFGTSPFYFYFIESFVQLIPPFSLLFLVSVVWFWLKHKSHLITLITVPYIMAHLFVGHKEIRFLFPMIIFLPFILILFLQSLRKEKTTFYKIVFSKTLKVSMLVVNSILLIFLCFKPADEGTLMYKKIYDYVKGEKAVLFYEQDSPYNNVEGLNYFKSQQIQVVNLADSVSKIGANNYFFSYKFNEQNILVKNNLVFVKVYSNFPDWIVKFNFNGWLQRASSYSLYKGVK